MTPRVPSTRVIPMGAWVTAGVLFLLFFAGISLSFSGRHVPAGLRILVPILVPLFVAGYTLLVGYVYGDARRRGMRYVMWTLLAIFIPNAIGIILYFILRDPLPKPCPSCGRVEKANLPFCPHCGTLLQPTCPKCDKSVEPTWANCAYCGQQLPEPATRATQNPSVAT